MLLREAKEILKKNGYKIISENNYDEAFYADVELLVKEFNETGEFMYDLEIDEETDDHIDAWINVSNNAEEDDRMVRFFIQKNKKGETKIIKWKEL